MMKNKLVIALCLLLLTACTQEADDGSTVSSELIERGLAAVAAKDFGKAEGIFESATDDETAQIYYAQIFLLREGQELLKNEKTAEGMAKLEAAANTVDGSALIAEMAKASLIEATKGETAEVLPIEGSSFASNETAPATTANQASDNLKAKQDYLATLTDIHLLWEAAYSEAGTSGEMKEMLWDTYDLWDAELNKIYGLLEEKLPPEEMVALRQEQRAWIKERDEQTGNPVEIGYLTQIEILNDLAKERTLYLIDLYFDEK